MQSIMIYSIVVVIALLLGFIIGYLISRVTTKQQLEKVEKRNNTLLTEKNFLLQQVSEKETQNTVLKEEYKTLVNQLQEELKTIRNQKETIAIEHTKKVTELNSLQEKLQENKEEVEKLQEKFSKEFENLANKILDEKSEKFTKTNEKNIQNILNPLKEKIEGFEKKVTETQEKSVGMHSALKEQLRGLKEMNQQISKEAINLTKALKGDSKIQGNWGETQLEMILEKAKLTKEIHYSTQGGFRDDTGKLKKPDFIINLPDNRHLIIDAKVSLTHYESYYSSENEEEKSIFIKKHIESIRKHIKELSQKNYADLYEINTPDYVLMFVPIEPALMLALNKVNNLYLESLDKNIVLVSTSTLLATLSTVSSMWRQENQKKNVLEIAKQAGKLYDQFVNLTNDLIKVGTQLKTVQGSYDTTMKKLTGKGNLIRKVENIKKLGATTSKEIHKLLLDRANEDT